VAEFSQRFANGSVVSRSNQFAQQLFGGLPARYDRLAAVLSLGQNGRWRRAMVEGVVTRKPTRILDVATGTCGVAIQLAENSGGWVAALDLTEEMLLEGRKRVDSRGLTGRVVPLLGRAEQLPFADASFDALTFTYLLRYVQNPLLTLAELARVVRPGGILAGLEFLVPAAPLTRLGWWLYTRVALPPAGWIMGGKEWFDVCRFLGPNITSHYRRYPLEWTLDAWKRAGLIDVEVRRMSLGSGLVMWGTKADG
jgi:demethylmenaquinone methyltransferase / 2-methoxy-6-polyprenyl-1,4-benzoquinol methylase